MAQTNPRVVIRLADGSDALTELATCGHTYKVPTWAFGAWDTRTRCDWCSTSRQRDKWDALVARRQQERVEVTTIEALVDTDEPRLAEPQPEPEVITCLMCPEPLKPSARKGYCSSRCKRLSQFPPQTCAHPKCDATFRTGDAKRRCCNAKHNRALYRLEHPNEPETLEARRERWQRRRALKRGASTGQPVRTQEIAERDGWCCQLCSETVDPDLTWPDPMSKSLDHVIPLARGGAHDPSNVQLAHLACNVAKGSSLVGA